MQISDVIKGRRSIRRFKADPVERELIEEILAIAVHSPSAKNEQPWQFVVATGEGKKELLGKVGQVLEQLKGAGQPVGSLPSSLRAMEEAPVLILVFNRLPRTNLSERMEYAKFLVDTQSLGAVIQTMLLTAQSKGLGSLWVCDVLYARDEIRSFLEISHELVAAVALGYPDEVPIARPRKAWQELTTFLA